MTNNLCEWHENEEPIDMENDGPLGCPNCGNLLAFKDCSGCGDTFMDWSDKGFDDCIAGPYVTESGDLACWRCGPNQDAEYERMVDDEGYFDPWDIDIYEAQP